MTDFIPYDKNFHFDGNEAELGNEKRTISDFWRWGYSDLIQNINRGILAEYIVAWALNLDKTPRNPWEAFDLITENGKRIEVKSTGYLQSWDYGTKPNPKFIIVERQRWTDTGLEKDADYNADVYVLCYHKETERSNLDPLNLKQWDFWVFSKKEIIKLLNGRKSITIRQLIKEDHQPIGVINFKKKSLEKLNL